MGLHSNDGLAQVKREVEEGAFPGEEYSPYKMSEDEEALFGELSSKGVGERERGKGLEQPQRQRSQMPPSN